MWTRKRPALVKADPMPSLGEQLEDMLHIVWECERDWRFDDRLDLMASQHRSTP